MPTLLGCCLLPASTIITDRKPTELTPFSAVPQSDGKGLFRLPNVVLFKAGDHTDMLGRRKTYDNAYVKAVADNFSALKTGTEPRVEPPAVLGHEIVQAKLAQLLAGDPTYQRMLADSQPTSGGGPGRTDEPAAGWPENVRFDASTGNLIGDMERIPPVIAGMIERGEVRFPSVEFKETLTRQDGSPLGPVLWRVALLGGTPPACKTIPPLGLAFSDPPDGVIYFAEASVAKATKSPFRDTVMGMIVSAMPGLSQEFLAGLDDDQLNQLAQDAMNCGATSGYNNATPAADAVMGDFLEMDTAALQAAYVESKLGTAEDAAKLTDDQLREACKGATTHMSDTQRKTVRLDVAAFADTIRQTVQAELAKERTALTEQGNAVQAAAKSALDSIAARQSEEMRAAVHAFCETELQNNKIASWQLDKLDPENLEQLLLRIPATETVCFADADGKEIKKTLLQAFMDHFRKGPARRRGERLMADPPEKDPRSDIKSRTKTFFANRYKKPVGQN